MLQVSELNSPYAISPSATTITPVLEFIENQSQIIATESKLIFTEGHRCLREMSRELLMYMMNCKDRIHDNFIPNCSPVAYALKGKSLNTKELWFLTNSL